MARELHEETELELRRVVKRMRDMTWASCGDNTSIQLNYKVTVESYEKVALCAEEHDSYMWASLKDVDKVDMTNEMEKVVLEALQA